jgi:hypothetical protein
VTTRALSVKEGPHNGRGGKALRAYEARNAVSFPGRGEIFNCSCPARSSPRQEFGQLRTTGARRRCRRAGRRCAGGRCAARPR